MAEELNYGPNGGLVYCMEYGFPNRISLPFLFFLSTQSFPPSPLSFHFDRFLANNLDWLEEELDHYEHDYLIFDCPGQIELYTHFPAMKTIKDFLSKQGYSMCAVYLMDSQFVEDSMKPDTNQAFFDNGRMNA